MHQFTEKWLWYLQKIQFHIVDYKTASVKSVGLLLRRVNAQLTSSELDTVLIQYVSQPTTGEM